MLFDPSKIKEFKNTTSVYPGKDNAQFIDVLSSDNKIINAVVKNEEAELLKFLKLSIGSKLKDKEMSDLVELIENYGTMRYEDGAFDESYEG